MATKLWVGDRIAVPQVDTATVTAAGSGGTTFKITHGTTGNVVSYLSVSGDTATTIAEGLATAIAQAAIGPAPEFVDFNPTTNAGVLTVTGPADGAPISWSTSATGGAGTIGATTPVTAPKSPHDYSDGANWSGGVAPAVGDILIFENGNTDVKYNLAAFTATALSSLTRRATFTGRIGLPQRSESGYIEFRGRYLEVFANQFDIECAPTDAAGQILVKLTNSGATIVNVVDPTATLSAEGQEPVYIHGFTSTSTLSVVGAGVRVCPETGQTAALPTLLGTFARVYVGQGATLTTVKLNSCESVIRANYTTLFVDRGGTCRVTDIASAFTSTTVQQGTIVWQSSGATNTLTVGTDAVFDATFATTIFATGTINLAEKSTLRDPNAKIQKPITYALSNTSLDKITVDVGTGHGGTWT